MRKLTLTFTFFCLFLSAFAQYTGGTGDGYASINLVQTNCQPIDDSAFFYGGNGDGAALANLTQTNCQPIDDGTFFYGGSGDGSALANLTLTNCQPIDDGTFFYGGSGDGAALANLTLTNCQPIDDGAFFYGGSGDGFASATIGICAPFSGPVPTALFSVSDSTLCIGDTVTFTDLSTESPNQWNWQFTGGNITTSSQQHPTVIYTTAGTYAVTLIASNNLGSDTLVKTTYITVQANPVPTITANGPTAICQGGSVTLTSSASSGNTWSTTATTQSITVTTAGSYAVTANNGTCTATSLPTVVTVSTTPASPTVIGGNTTVCSNSSYTYSVASVAGATSYTWSLPSGWSGTSTTNSITITSGTAGGTFSVTANNACGSSAPQTLSAIIVATVPAMPISISGNDSVCSATTNTYTIASVNGATGYTWTLPSGWSGTSTSTGIVALAGTTGGTISVTANNGCGSSVAQTIAVAISGSTPSIPGSISGSSTVCANSSETYSVSVINGAISYTWSLPSGWSGSSITNSISATSGASGGVVSVTATNACGTSSASTQTVSIQVVDASVMDMGGTFTANAIADSYQWINCSDNSIIQAETNAIFSPTVPGNYAVIITDAGCSDTSACYNFMSTGIFKNKISNIIIYPNPSTGVFSVISDTKVFNIEVVNMLGEVVYDSATSGITSTIELSNEPNGLYFVHITHEKGKSIEKLVLKK